MVQQAMALSSLPETTPGEAALDATVSREERKALKSTELIERAARREQDRLARAEHRAAREAQQKAERSADVKEFLANDEHNWMREARECPVFYPTLEEFADPLAFIEGLSGQCRKFGICKVVPPLLSTTPAGVVLRDYKFSTRRQALRTPRGEGNQFQATGKRYTLGEYEKMANAFLSKRFHCAGALPPRLVECEYWREFLSTGDATHVEYGSDVEGSGFSTDAEDPLGSSPWNLNRLPRLPGSLLSCLDMAIPGVTEPMLYVGMLFSTFCWHVEDHNLYSINYHHLGAPKTWYGVPGDAAGAFEEVVLRDVYRMEALEENAPAAPGSGGGSRARKLAMLRELHGKTTMFSPGLLARAGVPFFRAVQQPGEFVVTFPRSYHAGFSHGFNCGEAVNFAVADWTSQGLVSMRRYQAMRRAPVIPHDELLCRTVEQSGRPLPLDICAHFCHLLYQDNAKRLRLLAAGAHVDPGVRDLLGRPRDGGPKDQQQQRLQQDQQETDWPLEAPSVACSRCGYLCFLSVLHVRRSRRGYVQSLCLDCALHRLDDRRTPLEDEEHEDEGAVLNIKDSSAFSLVLAVREDVAALERLAQELVQREPARVGVPVADLLGTSPLALELRCDDARRLELSRYERCQAQCQRRLALQVEAHRADDERATPRPPTGEGGAAIVAKREEDWAASGAEERAVLHACVRCGKLHGGAYGLGTYCSAACCADAAQPFEEPRPASHRILEEKRDEGLRLNPLSPVALGGAAGLAQDPILRMPAQVPPFRKRARVAEDSGAAGSGAKRGGTPSLGSGRAPHTVMVRVPRAPRSSIAGLSNAAAGKGEHLQRLKAMRNGSPSQEAQAAALSGDSSSSSRKRPHGERDGAGDDKAKGAPNVRKNQRPATEMLVPTSPGALFGQHRPPLQLLQLLQAPGFQEGVKVYYLPEDPTQLFLGYAPLKNAVGKPSTLARMFSRARREGFDLRIEKRRVLLTGKSMPREGLFVFRMEDVPTALACLPDELRTPAALFLDRARQYFGSYPVKYRQRPPPATDNGAPSAAGPGQVQDKESRTPPSPGAAPDVPPTAVPQQALSEPPPSPKSQPAAAAEQQQQQQTAAHVAGGGASATTPPLQEAATREEEALPTSATTTVTTAAALAPPPADATSPDALLGRRPPPTPEVPRQLASGDISAAGDDGKRVEHLQQASPAIALRG